MATIPAGQIVIAKALREAGAPAYTSWDDAAEKVLAALTASGFRLIHPETSAEHCEDPWVCCIHTRPAEGSDNEDKWAVGR